MNRSVFVLARSYCTTKCQMPHVIQKIDLFPFWWHIAAQSIIQHELFCCRRSIYSIVLMALSMANGIFLITWTLLLFPLSYWSYTTYTSNVITESIIRSSNAIFFQLTCRIIINLTTTESPNYVIIVICETFERRRRRREKKTISRELDTFPIPIPTLLSSLFNVSFIHVRMNVRTTRTQTHTHTMYLTCRRRSTYYLLPPAT